MDEIEGLHEVTFVNGDVKIIDVERNIISYTGPPIYLEDQEGVLYNWQNIISVKKVGV